jgi:hypothetical protein
MMLPPNVQTGDEIEKLVVLLAGRIAVLIIVVLIAAVIF